MVSLHSVSNMNLLSRIKLRVFSILVSQIRHISTFVSKILVFPHKFLNPLCQIRTRSYLNLVGFTYPCSIWWLFLALLNMHNSVNISPPNHHHHHHQPIEVDPPLSHSLVHLSNPIFPLLLEHQLLLLNSSSPKVNPNHQLLLFIFSYGNC